MKKNEIKYNSNTYRVQNNILNLKNGKSNIDIIKNFNLSRNSFSKNKGKTLSNYNINKNCIIYNNNSKDIQNKNKDLLKSYINHNIRTVLENSEKFDINFVRRKSPKELTKEIKSKIYLSKTLEKKDNNKTFRTLN